MAGKKNPTKATRTSALKQTAGSTKKATAASKPAQKSKSGTAPAMAAVHQLRKKYG
jgi:hypothetical protein